MVSPIRFGLIGAGRWGKVYIRTIEALSNRCHLTYLCTNQAANAVLVKPTVHIVPHWRACLQADDCDALIVATPPHTHAEIVAASLEAGKPCIVEKPLCVDLETAKRLDELVRATGVPVLVDYTHLFDSAYQALKVHIQQSGEPIRVVMSEGMAFGPFRRETAALWDWCPHDVGLCLDLIGEAPRLIDVLGGPCSPDGVPEQLSLRLDFPSSACAWIHAGRLSWKKRRHLTVWTDTWLYHWDAQSHERLVRYPARFSERYMVPLPASMQPETLMVESQQTPMERMVAYFLDGIRGGDRRYFGTSASMVVTQVLAECERKLNREQAWHQTNI